MKKKKRKLVGGSKWHCVFNFRASGEYKCNHHGNLALYALLHSRSRYGTARFNWCDRAYGLD